MTTLLRCNIYNGLKAGFLWPQFVMIGMQEHQLQQDYLDQF